ncbi:MAG: hypothetical protein M1820_009631 [Bogoriella megaspora]|nr:MAG: hypothetical protein M1820_009631 [Bogoriella megaspora]
MYRIESLRSEQDELLRYVLDDDAASYAQVIDDLQAFIQLEGPFDGIVGFSEGGALAASLLLYYERRKTSGDQTLPKFNCAVFICSGDLVDPDDVLTKTIIRKVNFAADGHVIEIPTAHILSEEDDLYPGSGQSMRTLCEPSLREEFVHQLGHQVPGALSNDGVFEAARAIQRTIHRASAAKSF